MRIISSLGSVPIALLPRIHSFAFSDEVRKQDKHSVLLSTVTSCETRAYFWNFVKTNWDELKEQVTRNVMLGRIIKVRYLLCVLCIQIKLINVDRIIDDTCPYCTRYL